MTETTDPQRSLSAVFTVTIETRKGGDYYFDHDDLIRNVTPWIEGALEDRDDIRDVTITEQEPAAVPSAPADRAAHLREAADAAAEEQRRNPWTTAADVIADLRRMADEAVTECETPGYADGPCHCTFHDSSARRMADEAQGSEAEAEEIALLRFTVDAVEEGRRELRADNARLRAQLWTLAAALDGLHTLIATSSRDWGVYRVDAWLWAVLCGWDCEQAKHDDTCTHGAMEETAATHGWDDDTVAKARRYRAAVRILTEPAVGAQQPKGADEARSVCVCGHTRAEHVKVSGRLLCDACEGTAPDACREFDAL